ncbi:MAG TPA: ABC transporter substrate-binding protein [Hyphomicrobiaceae bacterium]|jgi:NitT/TauT family transport system substrate-binding protein|nr:ABC transporter substrate-binding protein [Hyphomicrobiaceae bacterium]
MNGLLRLRAGLKFGVLLLAFAAPGVEAQTPVKFTLDWRYEGPAAPFTVALDKGYFKAEGLDVTIDTGSGSRESIPRVAAGTYDIGTGDVNSLVRFRDENPTIDLKAVMMVYDAPPFAIVGRKSKGVTDDPKSLVGKKFGAPAADGAYAQWPIFKAVNKLDDSAMKFENVGFPVREPMLASGEVDAVFGFSFSVYLNLKSRGVPVDDISVILMRNHGVDLYGNVLMVSPKFAAEKPEAVKAFIRAVIKGTRDTVADPAAAAATIIKRNDVAKQDVEKERLDLALAQNIATPWVKDNGYGGIDAARFARSIAQIGLTFKFKNVPKVEDIFTEAFLPPPAERKVN